MLHIHLLGHVQIIHSDDTVVNSEIKINRQVQALLVYLLQKSGQNYPRSILITDFWGDYDESRARNCLNTTLWRLRGVLEPVKSLRGHYLVTTSSGDIGFNWHNNRYWIDLLTFKKQVGQILAIPTQAMKPADAQKLGEALKLYRGDLLAGFCESWAEWVIPERDRLRDLYVKGMAHLMHYYEGREEYELSLKYGAHILQLEPLREEVHRQMMRLYLANGQRAQAIRQYQQCQDILAEEYSIAPMPETQVLYSEILEGCQAGSQLQQVARQEDDEHLLQTLQMIKHDLEQTHTQFVQIGHDIAKLQKQLQDIFHHLHYPDVPPDHHPASRSHQI